eukprot:TRINITY_DN64353_c1_g1_i1.p5 TRINITY_DN64353_c1_g1~~TRINITY_DN64353_c1_g1_i1.p5  ORF type:complete len:118 (+),score=7.66 TRINITY_DN64353_c1_g1_i1:1692-2045(+)
MTARVLNNLNTKLIEMGKENVALSLFNLGLNSAFEKIKEEEITMPSKQMKRLVVLQQKKMQTNLYKQQLQIDIAERIEQRTDSDKSGGEAKSKGGEEERRSQGDRKGQRGSQKNRKG